MTPTGYLAKLRALSETGTTNAQGLAVHLGIGYETARTALRRLEAAGYVSSYKAPGVNRTETVVYKLTDDGAEALAKGAEPAVPHGGYVPVSQRSPLDDAESSAWQDLHEALGMGRPVHTAQARHIDRKMDHEPSWGYRT